MKKKIINTTPHDIIIKHSEFTEFIYEKSENPLRLFESQKQVGVINEIPIYKKEFLGSDLPKKIDNTFYIVSLIVLQAFPERKDFLIVNDTIRDENGRIVGAKSFAQLNFKPKH